MIRANIKSSEEVYVGLIEEGDDGYSIVWNKNIATCPGLNDGGKSRGFKTFEEACKSVYKVMQDAKICKTIYFKHS